ncbi:MAG TPA: DUF5681 domain-containing protein [Stellaceae bacterium]|nr:DUF5681 domain-containing protein [Stellaceae bacterium]
MPVDSLYKQVERGSKGRFAKGGSGNPAGRPKGAKNRATLLAEQFLEGEAAALARKAVAMALAGDAAALRLCLDRLIAPRRERPVRLALPALRGAGDLGAAMAAVADAAAEGTITPAEACELSQMLETYMRAVAAGDFERRLKQLEAAQPETPAGERRAPGL